MRQQGACFHLPHLGRHVKIRVIQVLQRSVGVAIDDGDPHGGVDGGWYFHVENA